MEVEEIFQEELIQWGERNKQRFLGTSMQRAEEDKSANETWMEDSENGQKASDLEICHSDSLPRKDVLQGVLLVDSLQLLAPFVVHLRF